MVVVSRWFGGTLLGPERFKHINNAARCGAYPFDFNHLTCWIHSISAPIHHCLTFAYSRNALVKFGFVTDQKKKKWPGTFIQSSLHFSFSLSLSVLLWDCLGFVPSFLCIESVFFKLRLHDFIRTIIIIIMIITNSLSLKISIFGYPYIILCIFP